MPIDERRCSKSKIPQPKGMAHRKTSTSTVESNEDRDSVLSFSSIASRRSLQPTPVYAKNGTTCSSRGKYVIHCVPSDCNTSTGEYLTPTQRASRETRRLQKVIREKDALIFQLTKELVELRLLRNESKSATDCEISLADSGTYEDLSSSTDASITAQRKVCSECTTAKKKIRELEKKVEEMREKMALSHNNNDTSQQEMYLQMYLKGKQAAGFERREQEWDGSPKTPRNKSSVSELLQQLRETKNELDKVEGSPLHNIENGNKPLALLNGHDAITLWMSSVGGNYGTISPVTPGAQYQRRSSRDSPVPEISSILSFN